MCYGCDVANNPKLVQERLDPLVTILTGMAASMVRGTDTCEKSHRNGEANPHIHFNDHYISRGRELSNISRAIREIVR